MIEGHGDDAWKYTSPIAADFSSNVLYGPLDRGLSDHLRECIALLTHYPEAGAQSLLRAAAPAYGVGAGMVLPTNGVTEAIYLIAQVFRQRTAVIYTPAFAEYEDACAAQGMNILFRDWEELRSGDWGDGCPADGLVFLCNPNNPTGRSVSLDRLGDYPDTLFVVDESYIDFSPVAKSVVGRGFPNVLVLRSLTKSCRIPGLRVGFVIGPASLVARLQESKMPWSVNRLAIEAGWYIFSHPRDFVVPVGQLRTQTAAWQEELRAALGVHAEGIGGSAAGAGAGDWKIWDTDTHYFLIGTPERWPADVLKKWLIEHYGLLVRDASNFKGLGRHVVRVACQSGEHNLLLTQALAECASTGQ